MQAVPSEFLEIDRKERANRPFFDLDLRPPQERTCDFDDVVISFEAECETWFVGAYDNCANAPTTALDATKQGYLKTCICDLPDASCSLLVSDGAEATVPACGLF